MSIQQTTIKASTLLTVLCLSAALTITSCGKKDAATTTSTTTTTPAATTPATGASTAPVTGAAAPLSVIEKKQLTAAKTALVMTNSAVKGGDMAKVKTQFEKFSGLFPAVEPILKAKAGVNYPVIASSIAEVKTAMTGGKLDKAKAQEGLNAAIKAMTAVIDKK